MLNPREFRQLVGGRRRGWSAACLRLALAATEMPYRLAMRLRNARYDLCPVLARRVGVPVVSVGNLTLGGTGKTPMVEWIARWFQQRDVRVAILSRGYAAPPGEQNDEAMELAQKLPGVCHLQNPNRVEAAERAIEEFAAELILLDDAFQHRRIHRDLDIVLLDALEPFGFGRVFPRGTLRESPAGLRRAEVAVLTRADLLEPAQREAIRRKAVKYAPALVWTEAAHVPRELLAADGRVEPLEHLRGNPVAAFCGLGNPAGFRHTLASCGYTVAGFRDFPDHYRYRPEDTEQLAAWAERLQVAAVVCSQKDLVKLGTGRLGTRPLWAVTIGMEFLAGEEAVVSRLAGLLPKTK